VRETLERILASETFGRSERARRLLRYLVEREQDGAADRLKGFSIAVDVFGKDTDFDSATDAVVRVQAKRLRELLRQYSATEGAGDPLRIVIPRGGYAPAYERNAAVPPAAEPEALPVPAAAIPFPSIVRQLKLVWLTFALVVAMLGVLIVRQNGMPTPADGASVNVERASTASIAISSRSGSDGFPASIVASPQVSAMGARQAIAVF